MTADETAGQREDMNSREEEVGKGAGRELGDPPAELETVGLKREVRALPSTRYWDI